MERSSNETTQLLQWIRKAVPSPRWKGLEDLANGVVWCRLMAKVQPGSIASVLIIHRPANERDAMHNYMLLQAAFSQANLSWYFDITKLIAGNQTELLKLGQSMIRLRDACNNQLQQQQQQQQQQQLQKKSTQRQTNLPHSSRVTAGAWETPQQLPKLPQKSIAVTLAVQMETEQQQQQSLLADQLPTPLTSEHEELPLKQQIQTLYHNQQLAMDEVQPFVSDTEMDPVAAYRPATYALCLCSKCLGNRQKLASTSCNCNS